MRNQSPGEKMRNTLAGKKKSELKSLARKAGVSTEDMDMAADADDEAATLIDLIVAIGLDNLLYTVEGFLQTVERRRVDHLLFDLGSVRAPQYQKQSRPENKLKK